MPIGDLPPPPVKRRKWIDILERGLPIVLVGLGVLEKIGSWWSRPPPSQREEDPITEFVINGGVEEVFAYALTYSRHRLDPEGYYQMHLYRHAGVKIARRTEGEKLQEGPDPGGDRVQPGDGLQDGSPGAVGEASEPEGQADHPGDEQVPQG